MRGLIVVDGTLDLVDDLDVRAPGPEEVKVRVETSGLCRSDLLHLESPDPRPLAMGHEAAGVVIETGADVDFVSAGDRVAVTCQRPCMRCPECARGFYSACVTSMVDPTPPFSWRGQPVRSMARSSSLASEIVVDQMQVHPVDALSSAAAALIGCAVSTGYGTIKNVAGLVAGETAIVIGVGGIGVNCLQTARLFGASRIVAADIDARKEGPARHYGADEFVLVQRDEPAERLAARLVEAVRSPVDVVVEGTGRPEMVSAGLGALSRGGRLALVGISAEESLATFDLRDTMARQLSIAGAWNGACNPFTDLRSVVELAESGELDVESQATARFTLADYASAIETLRRGDALRVVVDMND